MHGFVYHSMSPVSPPPRLPILHPSLFNMPVKTFHLPEYANAIAHQSITSSCSLIRNDFDLKIPGVLKYFDISAREEMEYSGGSSQQTSSASDSS